MLAHWPGVTIAGITTVNEDRGRRAGYARYLLDTAGLGSVPVFAGADVQNGYFRPKARYISEERYWPISAHPLPGSIETALEFLEQGVRDHAILVGIGPLTNFALLEH